MIGRYLPCARDMTSRVDTALQAGASSQAQCLRFRVQGVGSRV